MRKTFQGILLAGVFYINAGRLYAQENFVDSLFKGRDTTAVLDSLMADFSSYLDSISQPRSFFLGGIGFGTGFFTYQNKVTSAVSTRKNSMVYPSLSYYHKKGPGLSATGYGVFQSSGLQFYQLALSPSYDVLRKTYSTGIAYTHYFNRDSTDFYQTPIRNELFGYFTWKKWRVRPAVTFSYGWGSNALFEQEKRLILSRRLQFRDRYYVDLKAKESVYDVSITFSLRREFRWANVFSASDQLSLTPIALLSDGTQQYGFNTSFSDVRQQMTRPNALPSNNLFAAASQFSMQSASLLLRVSYLKGKFMVQPQYYADYYLPSTNTRKLSGVFSLHASMLF
ncbi:MAG: hypothetical protein RL732_331 [Bacteroidota bacterium]